MDIDSSASLPAGIEDLIDVFATELPEVRFADLDRAALEEDAARVRALAEAVSRAEAAAAAARADLAGARDRLVDRGQRAVAYARIYAEGVGNAELCARLNAVALNGIGRRGDGSPGAQPDLTPRRRGRPPKNASTAASGHPPLPLGTHEGGAPAFPVIDG